MALESLRLRLDPSLQLSAWITCSENVCLESISVTFLWSALIISAGQLRLKKPTCKQNFTVYNFTIFTLHTCMKPWYTKGDIISREHKNQLYISVTVFEWSPDSWCAWLLTICSNSVHIKIGQFSSLYHK